MNVRHSTYILIGIVSGIALAALGLLLFGQDMKVVKPLGDLFLRALRMVVVPLIVTSMVVGMAGIGDTRKLGRLGGRLMAFFATTTALAVILGVILTMTIRPGDGVPMAGAVVPERIAAKKEIGLWDIAMTFVSPNIVDSMAKGDTLPLIVFFLLLGGVLVAMGEKGRPAIAVFESLNEAMIRIVGFVMWMAPIGVFGLVASKFAEVGGPEEWKQLLAGIGRYALTILLGLGIHGLIVLPLLMWALLRTNPYRVLAKFTPAFFTAWSTASSSATIPVTMKCAEERAGFSPVASRFVIPIGATVNMDGTALYEAVAVIFIAQAYGIDLSFGQTVLIAVMATVAAIGAAGIPEAGLFTMVLVLTAVGLPLDGIGLILAIDWLLDRFRTAVNVQGDCIGTAFVDRHLREVA